MYPQRDKIQLAESFAIHFQWLRQEHQELQTKVDAIKAEKVELEHSLLLQQAFVASTSQRCRINQGKCLVDCS